MASEPDGPGYMGVDKLELTDLDAAKRQLSLAASGFRLTRIGDLSVTPPRWLIKGLIERDSLIGLFGPTTVGKSFFAVDAGACIATGRPFHGFQVKDPGPVIFIIGEGTRGITGRFAAWSLDHEVDLRKAPIFISSGPVSLCEPELWDRAQKVISGIAKAHGQPKLIVIDTWARMLGGNENSTEDAADGISALDQLRHKTGAAFLVVHHTGHGESGRARGSSVFRASMDTEISLSRQAPGDIVMNFTKSKESQIPDPLQFRLKDVLLGVKDEDGEELKSAVLTRVEYRAAPERLNKLGPNQEAAIHCLKKLLSKGNLFHDGVDMADWRAAIEKTGINSRRCREAIHSLNSNGYVLISGNIVNLPPES